MSQVILVYQSCRNNKKEISQNKAYRCNPSDRWPLAKLYNQANKLKYIIKTTDDKSYVSEKVIRESFLVRLQKNARKVRLE